MVHCRTIPYILLLSAAICVEATVGDDVIRPCEKNPFYWQLDGEPLLLLGGSIDDNLFQIPDLEAHLDLLASVGGNYIRCTMSCRDEGNVWWFAQDPETGLFDLNKPNPEFQKRFSHMMELTSERGIVVQIELWDRFDFARDKWQRNPYNPKNNINYSSSESGLMEVYELHPGKKQNAFFRSVPALENNQRILAFQHKQIDALLEISLRYGNVLYCMDNETNESPKWGAYWSEYVKAKAAEAGTVAMTTEMWDAHDLFDDEHKATLDHPEIYDFIDISQNNHNMGRLHWDNPQAVRRYLIDSGHIRPMNTVKIYGANSGRYGTTRDGQERFWRNILGGIAATRFHRPTGGLGLNPIAQVHIKSMRMALSKHDIFRAEPRLDLIYQNTEKSNEAYCSAIPGESYLIFFPDGGDIQLKVAEAAGEELAVQWLDIRRSAWSGEPRPVEAEEGLLRLISPTEEGYWAAVVRAL